MKFGLKHNSIIKGDKIMVQITKELANAIANYLATKPYGEVFQLINALGEAVKKSNVQAPTADGNDLSVEDQGA